jgi:hypothetical protein
MRDFSRRIKLSYDDGVERCRSIGNDRLEKIAQIGRNQLGWRQLRDMFLDETPTCLIRAFMALIFL